MRIHEQRNLLLASTFKTEKALHHFDGYLRSNKFQGIGEDYIRIQDVKNWLDNIRRELVKATREMDHFERKTFLKESPFERNLFERNNFFLLRGGVESWKAS